MSHPHATAPKRPYSSSSASASPAPPHMKKAKLPASSSSSAGPAEKNGLHLDPMAAAANAARGAGRTNGEEDAEMLLADQDELRAPGASAPGGVTANLFRKKATLPQPSSAAAPARKPLRIKIDVPHDIKKVATAYVFG